MDDQNQNNQQLPTNNQQGDDQLNPTPSPVVDSTVSPSDDVTSSQGIDTGVAPEPTAPTDTAEPSVDPVSSAPEIPAPEAPASEPEASVAPEPAVPPVVGGESQDSSVSADSSSDSPSGPLGSGQL
ncbi:MAG: hypothetical protein WDN66_00890 [Candidatus Saccharibacteria bacterium]